MASSTRVSAGLPFPLGATWDGSGVNVAVFSANASRDRALPVRRRGQARDRADRAARVHPRGLARLLPRPAPGPALRPARPRSLRARGTATASIRNKLLLDPYARAYAGELRWHDSLYGYRIGSSKADLSFDRRDSARAMPKCRIIDTAHTWGPDHRPRRGWAETVIYEAHVKGMTASHPEIAGAARRHLRGPRLAAGGRAPGEARGDHDRADADPGVLRRPPPRREGARELLGLQHHRLLRAGAALPDARQRHRRVQAHGAADARGRDRGDPRRRLQPHRRGQPARADPVASAVSTTPATTCWPTTRATISTPPAAATPSTPATRAWCRW